MLSLMYCATSGTWNQPIFSTCYALTLASMTIEETLAIELGMVYLLAAVGIVFFGNCICISYEKESPFPSQYERIIPDAAGILGNYEGP